ncbi:hypothetical protein FB45DRAFT_353923 [Roridomyces roridus]|uniref:F-box domain-containing protein n=1 Tax=Roridomyces roridus TaxID=1738132 RepID=A0AAD7C756_9AGAR|nr:hypothetical protein FB45DRAFT_353923 [Roridomyces roridus]
MGEWKQMQTQRSFKFAFDSISSHSYSYHPRIRAPKTLLPKNLSLKRMSTSSKFVPAVARARLAQLATQLPLTGSIRLERVALHQALTNYKYPVLSLPSEITSEIFVQFLPSYPERTSFGGPSSPALLLQVYRQWHDVALATPELWSTFKLQMGWRDTPAKSARRQCLLVEWLERSKNCLLSVELACSTIELPVVAAALFDALVRHSERWQDMTLSLPYQHLHRIAGSFPMIRDLDLDVSWAWGSDGTQVSPLRNFALQTPNLRKLGLKPEPNFNTFKGILPWSQITVFSGYLEEHDAAHVLRSAGALGECSLTVMAGDRRHRTKNVSPIPPRHNLKSLALHSTKDRLRLAKALAKALPALEIFDVSESLLGYGNPVGTLSAMCPPGYTGRLKLRDARKAAEVYKKAYPNVEELLVEPWVEPSYGCCACCDISDDEY